MAALTGGLFHVAMIPHEPQQFRGFPEEPEPGRAT
jgi:hypothetical protein